MTSPYTHLDIPLSRISESPTNPRKTFGDLTEMADSIREAGVLSPILVRPRGDDRYEIVVGHRRFRAAKEALLSSIPARVQEMDDREVLRAQLIENNQREDVHPLEEAEGFRLLHERYNYSAEDLAIETGKSKSFVYGRLRLCSLAPKVREAFLEERILPTVALRLTALPTQEQQERALDLLLLRHPTHPTADHAKVVVESLTRDLVNPPPPFDIGAENLIPKVPACTSCMKTTMRQPDLFGELKGQMRCLDGACFALKAQAAWEKTAAAAKKAGQRVLEGEETEGLFGYNGTVTYHHASGFVDLNEVVPSYDGGDGKTTWRERLGNPKPILARDPDTSRVYELAQAPDENDEAEAGGPREPSEWEKKHARDVEQRELRQEMYRLGGPQVVANLMAELAELGDPVLRLMAANVVAFAGVEAQENIAAHLGIEVTEGQDMEAAILAHLVESEVLPDGTLARMVAAREVEDRWKTWSHDGPLVDPVLSVVCDDFGIDLKKIEATAKRNLKKAKKEAGNG